MINKKYYQDIKQFPLQFLQGRSLVLELIQEKQLPQGYTNVVVSGMGGSSLYVDMINDAFGTDLRPNRTYTLPPYVHENTLCIVSSHSGNTEETLSCFSEILLRKLPLVVISSGGKLLELAQIHNIPYIQLPTGTQPRLCTGYFISAVCKILEQGQIIPYVDHQLEQVQQSLVQQDLNGEMNQRAQTLAKELARKVPFIYATDNIKSLARVSKIKFNENSKIQAFHNYFPEVNHHEMVGFTNLHLNPYFIIFRSKFSHPQNIKRINIFTKLMQEKNIPVLNLELPGTSVFEEIMQGYHFIDYVSYYLAQEYNIDPEKVELVEEFKRWL